MSSPIRRWALCGAAGRCDIARRVSRGWWLAVVGDQQAVPEVQLGLSNDVGVARFPGAGLQVGAEARDRRVDLGGGKTSEHRDVAAHGRLEVRLRACPVGV